MLRQMQDSMLRQTLHVDLASNTQKIQSRLLIGPISVLRYDVT